MHCRRCTIKKISFIHTNKEVPGMKFSKNAAFTIGVGAVHDGVKLCYLLRQLELHKIDFKAMRQNGETTFSKATVHTDDVIELFLDEPKY
jgi:hypothetical protein